MFEIAVTRQGGPDTLPLAESSEPAEEGIRNELGTEAFPTIRQLIKQPSAPPNLRLGSATTRQSRFEMVVRVLVQGVGRQRLDQGQQRSNAVDHPPVVKKSIRNALPTSLLICQKSPTTSRP
jgi:hypothetical protein